MIRVPFLPAFQLARATVRDPKTGVLTVASYRVSKRLAKVMVEEGWLLTPQLWGLPVPTEGGWLGWLSSLLVPAPACGELSLCAAFSAGPEAGESGGPHLSLLCPAFLSLLFWCSSWLEEDDDPVVARVNLRMQHITGLTVKTAELLQVWLVPGTLELGRECF